MYLSSDTKILKYVDREKQDKFSCERENTCKSMEFSKRDEYCHASFANVGFYTTKHYTIRKEKKYSAKREKNHTKFPDTCIELD